MSQLLLELLAEEEGYASVEDLLAASICAGAVPSICTATGCEYTTTMEPDQAEGYCDECGGQTVKSCLVLAGVI